ncbi:MAG: glutaredoxin domain-containing protein [Candidatus Gastranaerophilales bacterium]
MNLIEIYTISRCPYCEKAKKLFRLLNLEYKEYNIEDVYDSMIEKLSKACGRTLTTVPQILINREYIGGYDDLEAIYKMGKINEFLN